MPINIRKYVDITSPNTSGVIVFNPEPPPVIQLGVLSASPNVATVGTAFGALVSGRTAGSTLSLSGAGSVGLSISSETGLISGTPTEIGPIDITETLAGAVNSPRVTEDAVISSYPANAWTKPDGTPWRKPDNSFWLKAA